MKPIEILFADYRDFTRMTVGLCCDMPIKYRQVFVPTMTGALDRSLIVLAKLRIYKKELPSQLDALKQSITEWQIILEMLLDLKAVKETQIARLLDQSENLKKMIAHAHKSSH